MKECEGEEERRYVYWFDMAYPNGEYSGYQNMLPDSIYGIPYKIGTNHTDAIRTLSTAYASTKYLAIVTGRKKKRLVHEVHNAPSLVAIYIIKPFAEKVERWTNKLPKVKVFRCYSELVTELKAILKPLNRIREISVDTKTAIEYMAHPRAMTMKQQTVSALGDEKKQQDDQLLYQKMYALALNLVYLHFSACNSADSKTNGLNAYLAASKVKKVPKPLETYLAMIQFSLRLDEYPLVFAGISIPEVRELLRDPKGDISALCDCFSSIDPDLPLGRADPAVIQVLHTELVQLVAKEVSKKIGSAWTKLYFTAMQLGDIDFCFKMFMQQLADCALDSFKDPIHTQHSANLAQASVASDIRISAFNDVVQRTQPPKEEERGKCLSEAEARKAFSTCGLSEVLILDVNTSYCSNELQPLVPILEAKGKHCRIYKLIQDFVTDRAALGQLRNKLVYLVFSRHLEKLEYDRLLDTFIRESITPIVMVYVPKALESQIAKSMFKHKWIVTTVYAETFKDIVDYVGDVEIDIGHEMAYYSNIYTDFAKTVASYQPNPSTQLSHPDSVEQDVGFEVVSEINSDVFSHMLEELSLGTKLIGSLHYYMWKLYQEKGKKDVYWEWYAPLFGIAPKTLNILDVNFGKNILRAYTLQNDPPFYWLLNDAFRGGNPQKMSQYRGFYVILHDLIKKGILKNYVGCVYRGTFFNPQVLANLRPGLRIFSTCFTSTSKSHSVAHDFARKTKRNVLLEIELDPHGHSNVDIHLEEVSRYPEEQEVLLLPFTAFEVTLLSQEGSLVCIHLKEILQEVDVAALKGIDYYN